MKRLILAFLLCASPAIAQQPTPSEIALQINGVIGVWAQSLVQQGKMIEDLQKQLTAANVKIQELEKKPEPVNK
jgi:hypothetical protein